MSGMQKVLLGGALAVLLLCSGAGLFVYYRVWPNLRAGTTGAVAEEVAFQIDRSMEDALVTRSHNPCVVTLSGSDLDFSTYTDNSGYAQVDITNNDAAITNGYVELSLDGIDLYLADAHLHGSPAIQDGAFTLVDTRMNRGITSLIFDDSALETGFIQGVNAGFQRAGLTPVTVELLSGTMLVGCEETVPL